MWEDPTKSSRSPGPQEDFVEYSEVVFSAFKLSSHFSDCMFLHKSLKLSEKVLLCNVTRACSLLLHHICTPPLPAHSRIQTWTYWTNLQWVPLCSSRQYNIYNAWGQGASWEGAWGEGVWGEGASGTRVLQWRVPEGGVHEGKGAGGYMRAERGAWGQRAVMKNVKCEYFRCMWLSHLLHCPVCIGG